MITANLGTRGLCATLSSLDWIINSGVSSHMTSQKNMYSSISLSLTHQSLYLADRSTSIVARCCDIFLSSSLPLSNVLLVPKFSISLLSVSQLTKSLGCGITFFLDACIFQDLKTKRMIDRSREKGRLYYFNTLGVLQLSLLLPYLILFMIFHLSMAHSYRTPFTSYSLLDDPLCAQ